MQDLVHPHFHKRFGMRKRESSMGRKAVFSLLFFGALSIAGCTGSFTSTPLTQSSTITSINLSCVQPSVQPGQTNQCSVTVTGTGGYSPTVSWSAAYGTITGAGLYTAPSTPPASGSDTIKAASMQDPTKSGTATVAIATAVAQPIVTKVAVSATPSSLSIGQTATCTANVTGTGAYNSAVTWTASGGTITSGGVFTPTAVGTGTCTANSTQTGYSDTSGSANITVTAAAPVNTVTNVAVVATPASITTGQTASCVATVTGTGAYSSAVSWTATGGTITSAGVFTPSGVGTGTCTANSTQAGYTNISSSTNITVTAPAPTVTKVSAVATPASITTGQTATCVASVTGTGAYSSSVAWTATGGTITQAGVFTPSGTGTGTCTANSTQSGYTNISGSATITTSNAAPTVTKVSVIATPASITTGQTATCVASVTGTGAYSPAVTWTATGGTITQAGVFTPSGVGTGSCIANSAQAGYTSVSGSSNITVTSPAFTITGITVAPTPASITMGQSATCGATVSGTGTYPSTVTWTATGGTISSAGVFTPSGAGTAACTATSAATGYTNMSGSAKITVTAVTPTVTKVGVVATPASITTAQPATCVATVTGTGAYSPSVTWTATGGTITQAGVFTPSGVGTGSCIANSAQAGYTNVSGSANITVTSAAFTITGITVAPTPASITTTQTSTCAATVSGTGAYPSTVTWTATGGTISSAGVLTPSGAGTATCTATSAAAGFTNISGSANITVTAVTPTITGVSLVCSPLSITAVQTSSCTPTVTGTGAFTNTVNLSVSPTANGTLSGTTAVASGTPVTFTPPNTSAETATITATSTQDSTKSGTATITVTVSTGAPTCSGMSLGDQASLNGFVPFPSAAAWNINIASAPLDPNSAAIIAGFSGSNLHPDFSSVSGGDYGIPYTVVDSSTQPLVPINVGAYASESDVAEAPFPATAPIEGQPADCSDNAGDQHVLVLDRNTCMLYETYNTVRCSGTYSADSETIWDLQNFEQRPWGWTSADAAGLSVFPGLVRYDEVAAGVIKHAIRFTLQNTMSDSNGGYFVEPASHAAGNSSSSMNVEGMRIRLKASVDISGFSSADQVILTAMKQYGMILADNGSNLYFQGDPDPRWDDDDLSNLKSIPGSDFEVVQMTPPFPGWDANTAPTGAAPTINSFTASASTVTSGTAATLTWSTSNDSYDFIDKLGGVRGGSITITPTATTTYTLNATNQYGRSTQQVTVAVQ